MRAKDGKAIHLIGGIKNSQRVEVVFDTPNNRFKFIINDGSTTTTWYLDSQGLHS